MRYSYFKRFIALSLAMLMILVSAPIDYLSFAIDTDNTNLWIVATDLDKIYVNGESVDKASSDGVLDEYNVTTTDVTQIALKVHVKGKAEDNIEGIKLVLKNLNDTWETTDENWMYFVGYEPSHDANDKKWYEVDYEGVGWSSATHIAKPDDFNWPDLAPTPESIWTDEDFNGQIYFRNIMGIPVESVETDNEILYIGDAISLGEDMADMDAVITPSSATTQVEYWEVVGENLGVITLNQLTGEVKGYSEGVVTVKVTVGSKSDTATVTVLTNNNPVIELAGSDDIHIYKGSPYVDQGAVVKDAEDGESPADVDDANVDTSVVGSTTITYSATDSDGNVATPVTRKVTVLESPFVYIVDPEANEIGTNGYTLVIGTAVDAADGEADLDFVIVPVPESTTGGAWSLVSGPTDVINLDENTGEVEALKVGEVTVQISISIETELIEGFMELTDEAIVKVISNNIPVIDSELDDIEVEQDDMYTEPGASVTDIEDGNFFAVPSGNVNTSELGEYTITYYATDSDNNDAVPETRTVNVVKKPVETVEITDPHGVIIGTDGYTLYIGDMSLEEQHTGDLEVIIDPDDATYQSESWELVDDVTGIITIDSSTGLVTAVSEGTVAVKVTVDGKSDTADVHVKTNNRPVITVLGDGSDEVTLGQDYTDSGATVYDMEDETVLLLVTGTVNTGVVGTYTLYYDAVDSDNNNADQKTRSVEVVDGPVVIIVDPVNPSIESDGVTLHIGPGATSGEDEAQLEFKLMPEETVAEFTEWILVDGNEFIDLDSNGLVKGHNEGVATVKVVSVLENQTEVYDTVIVTVEYHSAEVPEVPDEPETPSTPSTPRTPSTPSGPSTPGDTEVRVTIDPDAITLDYGEGADPEFTSFDFKGTVFGTPDKRVTWSLDDDTFVTVDRNGVVTTIAEVPKGTGDITVEVTVTSVADKRKSATAIVLFEEKNPLGAIEFYDPYVSGYPDGSFGPARFVSRAEIATMFARILQLNLEVTGSQEFTDVDESQWYFEYVQAIARTNIFVGYENGEFRPDNPMSRAEIAAVFAKFWQYKDITVNGNQNTPVSDVPQTHWASSYIYRIYNANVVSGFPDGTFRPDQPTLREQIVVMVNTLIARPENKAVKSKFTDILNSHWSYGHIEAASQPFVKQQDDF